MKKRFFIAEFEEHGRLKALLNSVIGTQNNKENKLSNYFNLTVNHLEFFYYGN